MNCIARHALVHGGKNRLEPTCRRTAAAAKNATEEKVPCFYNYTIGFWPLKLSFERFGEMVREFGIIENQTGYLFAYIWAMVSGLQNFLGFDYYEKSLIYSF